MRNSPISATKTNVIETPVKISIAFEYDVFGISKPAMFNPIVRTNKDKAQITKRTLKALRFNQNEIQDKITIIVQGI